MVLTSQPFAAMESQSANPGLHAAIAHVEPTQFAAPLAAEHTWPHVLQLFTLLVRFDSQPLAVIPSQLPKPALHAATVQVPPAHPGMPFGAAQTFPQVPQLLTLLVTLVSQPFAALPSQLAKPALQAATAHAPPAHAAVPLAVVQT